VKDEFEMSEAQADHYTRMLFDPAYEPQVVPRDIFEEWRQREVDRIFGVALNPLRALFRDSRSSPEESK
jgi:hypothetical protein